MTSWTSSKLGCAHGMRTQSANAKRAPSTATSTTSELAFTSGFEQDFERYSRHYLQARAWSQKLTEPYEAVYFNARNNFTLQYPLLLAPVRPTDSQEVADEKMRLVATYIDIYVARRIVNYRSLGLHDVRADEGPAGANVRRRARGVLLARLEEMPEQLSSEAFSKFRIHQQNQSFVFNLLARLSYFVDRESATPTTFDKDLDRSSSNRYDIEHVWPGQLDAYPDRFATREQAAEFRDRVGGLVLLPEKVNRSPQALPFEHKRDKHLADNLLAGSVHPAAYVNNPGFTRWIHEAGLRFKSYDDFTADALDERQALCLRLAQLV
jgi:hypothetical protein